MKNTIIKIISMLLIVVMLCQMAPLPVFAAQKELEAGETASEKVVSEKIPADNGKENISEYENQDVIEGGDLSAYDYRDADVMYEETGLREDCSKHFRMSDGSSIAVQYDTVIHYRDQDGSWTDIDNTLRKNAAGGYTVENGNSLVAFPETLEDGLLYDLRNDKYHIVFRIGDRESGYSREAVAEINNRVNEKGMDFYDEIQPDKLDSELTFRNVYDGIDLQYHLHGFHIKESIIIHAPQDEYTYTFELHLDNLIPEMDKETGAVRLIDGKDEKYIIPPPYMVDAQDAYSEAVAYDLVEIGPGEYILSVKADPDWINSKERVFPVSIDPTLNNETEKADGPITGTYVRSGSPSAKQTSWSLLNIGKSTLNSEGTMYAYLNINSLPSIPKNCIITDARIHMYNTYFDTDGETAYSVRAYRVTSDKPSSYSSCSDWIKNLTYYTKPGSALYSQDYQIFTANNTYDYVSWDVVRLAQDWYVDRNRDANRSIALMAENFTGHAVTRLYVSNVYHPAYFIVSYRNTVGLENYMSCQAQSIDRAGTLSVSDYTKQITLTHPDVTFDLGTSDFSLYHVYNSANAAVQYTNSASEGIHTKIYNAMKLGKGWKLSAQETVVSMTVGSTDYLVYNDADATEHYFYKSGSKWLDEDGLGLTITKTTRSDGNIVYTMTDKDAYNTKEFFNGCLTIQTDSKCAVPVRKRRYIPCLPQQQRYGDEKKRSYRLSHGTGYRQRMGKDLCYLLSVIHRELCCCDLYRQCLRHSIWGRFSAGTGRQRVSDEPAAKRIL